jgi:type II secretory pathway pseudopilin PulG
MQAGLGRSTATPARSSRAGFGILELLIALSVMLLGLSGLVSVLLENIALGEQARNMAIAVQAARSRLEQLQGADLSTTFASFNDFAGDDPAGAPGPGFAVPGLDPDPADGDGMTGDIAFPVAAGGPGTLSETDPAFPGMPRDLNLDGDAVDADVTADFGMLPVVIRLRWRASSGAIQRYEVCTILFGP